MARYKTNQRLLSELQTPHNISAWRDTLEADSDDDVEASATVPGSKLHRLIGVSFGLLCILQATLNISLRVGLFSHHNSVTEDRDKLKLINFEIEERYKNLTEERNHLKMMLSDFGWTFFGNSAYYVSSTTKTWQESRDDCRQKTADLMIINSEEEQNFANKVKKRMWIGLTDGVNEGTWKWVDGTPLKTSYWFEKEPNGDTSENCGEVKEFKKNNSWNDQPCSTLLNWICEKRLFI